MGVFGTKTWSRQWPTAPKRPQYEISVLQNSLADATSQSLTKLAWSAVFCRPRS